MKLFITLFFLVTGTQAFASPSFCRNFQNQEFRFFSKGIERSHVFKIGQITLVGLAVGASYANEVSLMAQRLGGKNSCVWYQNRGNKEAQRIFNHNPLPYPSDESDLGLFEDFMENILSSGKLESCIKESHFVAMGCNEMKHRGPTAFGMLLAFAGCSAEEASNMVNSFWGLNGVEESVRYEVIRRGVDLRNRYPQIAQEFQRLLGN